MKKIKVNLNPIISGINLPTVIKTARLPGKTQESLFVATQVGEIFSINNKRTDKFLDIQDKVIFLGSNGGYDERGLLGLAFHPEFPVNGLFYLHYSLANSQGPGALAQSFQPNPCDVNTLNLKWINRESKFDHIDTLEEWIVEIGKSPEKKRTLLNLRRPFSNHNGANTLHFSLETGKLIFFTGDGGSAFDPFNLSQSDLEIAGKMLEIDVSINPTTNNTLVVTRFDELPEEIQKTISITAKGIRNITGITHQRVNNQYVKYVPNVGQNLVESIFSYIGHKRVPIVNWVRQTPINYSNEILNFGWRGWEGAFPTTVQTECRQNKNANQKAIAYYKEAVATSASKIQPLVCYFHEDNRSEKFSGTALTGLSVYNGSQIPELTGAIVFCDLAKRFANPTRGVLAYSYLRGNCVMNDYNVIDVNYDYKDQDAYYVSMGSNSNQTKLYLGVYRSTRVTELGLGTVFEIVR